MKNIYSLLLAALMISSQTAQAALTTFNDRGTWNTALGGGPDYTVDFNDVTTDTSYNDPATFDAGPLTLTSVGADVRNPEPLNLVDANPFLVTSSINGSTDAVSRIGDNSTAITITFDQPISAFGGDFASISDSTPVVLTLSRTVGGTDSVSIPTIGATAAFFGFATNPIVAYSSLSFSNNGTDEFWRMDNLSALTAVPEPASVLLLGVLSLMMLTRQGLAKVS